MKITWRGGIAVALAVSIGAASLHRGHNLLLAVACLLLGLVAASALMTALAARKLEIMRRLPHAATAYEPFAAEFEIRIRGGLCPAAGLEIQDHFRHEGRHPVTQPDPIPLPALAPGGRLKLAEAVTAHFRGPARFTHASVTSEFPPGFFQVRTRIPLEGETLVYPRRGILSRRAFLERLASAGAFESDTADRPDGHDDFAGVREFREGDNPRWIHWKASARLPGRRVVKEFEDGRVREAVVLLESWMANTADARRTARLERAVSFAIALSAALLDEGYRVTFRTFAPEPVELHLENRADSIEDLRIALARLKPARKQRIQELAPAPGPSAARGALVFLLAIGDEAPAIPVAPERLVVFRADEMRTLMHYAG